MDSHSFVGLGYYATSNPAQQSYSTESSNPYQQYYGKQQSPSTPNTYGYDVYGDHLRTGEVNFVPMTDVTANETPSDHATFAIGKESTVPPGLPPLPVGVSEPSGSMPAYLQHSQMLPSFPSPLVDGPPRTISIPQTEVVDTSALQQQQQQIEEGRNKALEILKQFGAVKRMEESQIQKVAEIGRSKALAILENQKLQMMSGNDGHLLSLDALPPEEWARRRRVCFEKLQRKYEKAIFRNFEYVARVGEERLKAQAKQLQNTERYHSEMESYHAQVLQDRAKAYATVRNKDYSFTVAGIGTQQRQKAERKRKRTQGQQDSSSSVAIYVSNLPTDGSVSEELMRALFGSYGSLRKIHFYMDKRTGQPKGDALVIYNTSISSGMDDDRGPADVKSSIVEAVCSQMNGAELSCGTCIKVEPSDPVYQLRKKKEAPPNYYGKAGAEDSQTAAPAAPAAVEENAEELENKEESAMGVEEGTSKPETGDDNGKDEDGKDEDDLDDFFASL